MEKSMIMHFSTSFDAMRELDDTRTLGLLRVCYTGENRNRTYISKKAIEDAIPSMFNCPIVCNYDYENDTIGGHDVVVASDDDGNMFFVNLTDGIGTIPESANYYFEEVEEDDGTINEYFVTEAILWKRAPAYRKIATDGIVGQSMEILVRQGKSVDGIYHIDKFIFTAFCLLGDGIQPCFESASLRVFDLKTYREKLDTLMSSMRTEFAKLDAHTRSQQLPKGGEKLLELSKEKRNVLQQYHLLLSQLDGTMEEINAMDLAAFTTLVRETAKKFDGDPDPEDPEEGSGNESGNDTGNDSGAGNDTGNDSGAGNDAGNDSGAGNDTGNDSGAGADAGAGGSDSGSGTDGNGNGGGDDSGSSDSGSGGGDSGSGDSAGSDDDDDDEPGEDDDDDETSSTKPKKRKNTFSLTTEQMREQMMGAVCSLGTISHEWGECPAYIYVDYSLESNEVYCWDVASDWTLCGFTFSMNGDNIEIDVDSKRRKKFSIVDFDEGEQTSYSYIYACIAKEFTAEIESLRSFKATTEKAKRDAEVEAVFAAFVDLDGIEAFDNLKANNGAMTAEQVKHECYAIRGEHATVKFSANAPKSNRIPIEQPATPNVDEPYGGFYKEFPPTI